MKRKKRNGGVGYLSRPSPLAGLRVSAQMGNAFLHASSARTSCVFLLICDFSRYCEVSLSYYVYVNYYEVLCVIIVVLRYYGN